MNRILFLKTADATCQVGILLGEEMREWSWESGRGLADGLLKFLQQCLGECGLAFADLTGIVAFRGPGSYTSLRIGLTVANTLADGLKIPIIGAETDDWQKLGLEALSSGENQRLITPIYLQPAVITPPRK